MHFFIFFKINSVGGGHGRVYAYRVRVHRGPSIRYGAREIITLIWMAKTPFFCKFFAGIEIYGQKYPREQICSTFRVRIQKKCFAQQKSWRRLPSLGQPKVHNLLIPFLSPISIV